MDYKVMPWYFKILGFYYKYKMQLYDNPFYDEIDDRWVYQVKLLGYELWWIGIKIKYYDRPQD